MKKLAILLVIFNVACANESISIGNETYIIKSGESGLGTHSTHTDSKQLINQRTGKIATITGNLVVTLTNIDAETIASRYGLTIVNNFAHIHTVFFSANGQNVFDLKSNMSKDSDIDAVEIDLIENIRTTH